MDNDVFKRLIWTGLLAATGALASVAAHACVGGHLAAAVPGGPARVSTRAAAPPTPPPATSDDERSVGELVIDISEQTSYLIREEIELAKAEVTEKVTKLVQGSVVAIAAGVFVLMALAMFMHGIAWLLNDLFFSGNVWAGFLIEAAVLAPRRGGRGPVRVPPVPGRLAADARARDRGGKARQAGLRGRARRDARRPAGSGRHGVAMSDGTDVYVSGAGEPVAREARVPGERSAAQIRTDIETARVDLSHSVESLRGRVNQLTDWRRQVREHRRELVIGAAVAGFVVGGLIALRRRGGSGRAWLHAARQARPRKEEEPHDERQHRGDRGAGEDDVERARRRLEVALLAEASPPRRGQPA